MEQKVVCLLVYGQSYLVENKLARACAVTILQAVNGADTNPPHC